MAGCQREIEQALVAERDGIRPERVMSARAELAEPFQQSLRRQPHVPVGWIGEHAKEAIFRDGTGGPAKRPVVGEPVVRQLVMHVVRVEQRHEHIHIEQRKAIHVDV